MIQLFKQIKWQFLIFQRNNIVTMIVGITAFYVLIIYLIKDFAGIEKLITLLIYNDPALVGFIFIGISIILEKDQEVLPALFVTPLNFHLYLIPRIITLSAIGFFGALMMVLTATGTSFNFLHFSIGAFSTSVLFCLLGIFIVSYTTEILHFLLRAIPLLIFMSLPLLNYFELTNFSFLKLFPVQGGLNLMVNSYRELPDAREIIFGYASIAVWTPLLYWLVSRNFISRMSQNLNL
jgi:fluoroquinolone transport system permease protein